MTHAFASRTPFFPNHGYAWAGLIALLASSSASVAAQSTPPAVGEQVATMAALQALPDGNHQFCSEPEPQDFRLGAGQCYWFNKQDNEVIGYYGRPHSSDYIDCVKGQIQTESIVGNALEIAWDGNPYPVKGYSDFFPGDHLILESGQLEHQIQDQSGQVQVVTFARALLSLQNFYRYSQAKVEQMQPPPVNCNVQAWIAQLMNEASEAENLE